MSDLDLPSVRARCENCGRCAGCHRDPIGVGSCEFTKMVTCGTLSCAPEFWNRPDLVAAVKRLRAANLELTQRIELDSRRHDGGPIDPRQHVQPSQHFTDMGDCACECVACYRLVGRDPCICPECPGKFHNHEPRVRAALATEVNT